MYGCVRVVLRGPINSYRKSLYGGNCVITFNAIDFMYVSTTKLSVISDALPLGYFEYGIRNNLIHILFLVEAQPLIENCEANE